MTDAAALAPLPPAFGILKKRRQFLAAAAHKRCATHGLVLQRRPRDDTSLLFGLTASKRVGNAVARNRAKRRLRVLAREVLPACARPGDFVLIAKTETIKRDFKLLRGDLLYALKKLDALRRAP